MPKYEVLELSYIGNSLVQPGTVIEFDGTPGYNLRAVAPPAKTPADDIDDLLE